MNKTVSDQTKAQRYGDQIAKDEKLAYEARNASLAQLGYKIGRRVWVEEKQSYYTLSHIRWGSRPESPFLYFYGFKIRADGTVGTHAHPLGQPKDVMPA